jgi:hypothetical protein
MEYIADMIEQLRRMSDGKDDLLTFLLNMAAFRASELALKIPIIKTCPI